MLPSGCPESANEETRNSCRRCPRCMYTRVLYYPLAKPWRFHERYIGVDYSCASLLARADAISIGAPVAYAEGRTYAGLLATLCRAEPVADVHGLLPSTGREFFKASSAAVSHADRTSTPQWNNPRIPGRWRTARYGARRRHRPSFAGSIDPVRPLRHSAGSIADPSRRVHGPGRVSFSRFGGGLYLGTRLPSVVREGHSCLSAPLWRKVGTQRTLMRGWNSATGAVLSRATDVLPFFDGDGRPGLRGQGR